MRILRVIKKIVTIILVAVMLIIFCGNFYIMIKSYKNPGTHPDVFGYSIAIVISGSMMPEIAVDDLVVIKEQTEYEKGDIVAFSTGKSLVTHRIHEVADEGFITKGDANNTPDEGIVPISAVSGKVIRIVPGIGRAISFLRSPLGMLLIMLLAFGAIVMPDKSEKEEQAEEK